MNDSPTPKPTPNNSTRIFWVIVPLFVLPFLGLVYLVGYTVQLSDYRYLIGGIASIIGALCLGLFAVYDTWRTLRHPENAISTKFFGTLLMIIVCWFMWAMLSGYWVMLMFQVLCSDHQRCL